MASRTAASTSVVTSRPSLRSSPARQTATRTPLRIVAKQQQQSKQALVAATVASVSALSLAMAPHAMAAQEAFMMAEGEPVIVQAGWAALCVSFSASLAFVVWGRSGL